MTSFCNYEVRSLAIKEVEIKQVENQLCPLLPDCEDCRSFYINKCEVHGPAHFIIDTPVTMGVIDRARQTLPPCLEVRQSGIPDAGLGVFNKGETVPVGAHFGPYQGDLVDREEAVNSGYSWVVSQFHKIIIHQVHATPESTDYLISEGVLRLNLGCSKI